LLSGFLNKFFLPKRKKVLWLIWLIRFIKNVLKLEQKLKN
jgi:hypothetical protein